jgi:hypothetical protein
MESQMIKSFEDVQNMNKEGFEAFSASTAAVGKSAQVFATEVADYSKKSFEKSAAVWQNAVSAKSFEKAVEIQQTYAKETFEAGLAEFTKLGELAAAAAKAAFKPYEATFAAFGVKAPAAK